MTYQDSFRELSWQDLTPRPARLRWTVVGILLITTVGVFEWYWQSERRILTDLVKGAPGLRDTGHLRKGPYGPVLDFHIAARYPAPGVLEYFDSVACSKFGMHPLSTIRNGADRTDRRWRPGWRAPGVGGVGLRHVGQLDAGWVLPGSSRCIGLHLEFSEVVASSTAYFDWKGRSNGPPRTNDLYGYVWACDCSHAVP